MSVNQPAVELYSSTFHCTVFNRFTKKLKDLVRGTIFKWCVLMVEEVCGSRLKPVRLGLR